jgi:hypothetical protein
MPSETARTVAQRSRGQSVLRQLRRQGSISSPCPPAPAADPRRRCSSARIRRPGKAKLTVIKGEGMDGVSTLLQRDRARAGRNEGAIMFPGRPAAVAPRMQTSSIARDACTCSTRARSTACSSASRRPSFLGQACAVLIGEQCSRSSRRRPTSAPQPDAEGTYFYASPKRPSEDEADPASPRRCRSG